MFTSISINNFRGFKALNIEGFERVNLIAGKNNVGKTALLEALFILSGGANITLVVEVANLRGVELLSQATVSELVFSSLFTDYNNKTKVRIEGYLNTGEEQSVEFEIIHNNSKKLLLGRESKANTDIGTNVLNEQVLELTYKNSSEQQPRTIKMQVENDGLKLDSQVPEAPLFPAYFIPSDSKREPEEDAEHLGKLEISKEPYNLVEALRIIEPRLKRITAIFVGGRPIIYADIGINRMLPLFVMGEGLSRLISILLTIANTRQGIVLIDEIENGLHYSVLSKVWQAIADAARRFDTQVIATTHSYECIQAAHQAFSKSEKYDFRLHRLDRINNEIKAVTYDRETLEAAMVAGFEVR